MAVSKRLRYEILRRDNHTCRYCGESAPDVRLTIDHVVPVSLGGSDEPDNLVAACPDCNAGKAASNPDAPLVADVSDKAVRWAAALQYAVNIESEKVQVKHELSEYFEGEWYGRHEIQRYEARKYELPEGWEDTVWRFWKLGITGWLMDDAIDIAHRSRASDKFRYFCGVCWTKIRALQDLAFEIVEADDGA